MARPRSAKKFRGFLVHAHPFNWTKKSVAKIMASGRSVESHAASQRELLVGGFTADVPAWKRSLSTATLPSEPRRARRTQRNFFVLLVSFVVPPKGAENGGSANHVAEPTRNRNR